MSFGIDIEVGAYSCPGPHGSMEVRIVDSVLRPSPGLGAVVGTWCLGHWPGVMEHVNDALGHLIACSRLSWLVVQLTFHLARGLDDNIKNNSCDQLSDSLAPFCLSTSRNIDPELREAVSKLGPNPWAVARQSEKLGLRLGVHSAWVDRRAQLRYLLASTKALAGATTIATSVDATRFSGKNWMAGLAMTTQTGIACWMPPQVINSKTPQTKSENPLGEQIAERNNHVFLWWRVCSEKVWGWF